MSSEAYRILYRFSSIWMSLGIIVVYNLGVGIARYLGTTLNISIYFLGLVWVLGLQFAIHFLNDYFERLEGTRIVFENLSEEDGEKPDAIEPRYRSLLFSAFLFTSVASITIALMNLGVLTPSSILIMSLSVIGSLLYVLPPLRLKNSGYGEILAGFLIVNLVPFWGYVLQDEVLHRFVPMGTFPLTGLFLGMVIILQFPVYGVYMRQTRRLLSIRMGWENSIVFHNALILGSFFLLLIAAVFGFPRFAVIPAFFTLPLGIWQIWYINQIAKGVAPNWNLVTFGSVGIFGVAAYILAFSFWIH